MLMPVALGLCFTAMCQSSDSTETNTITSGIHTTGCIMQLCTVFQTATPFSIFIFKITLVHLKNTSYQKLNYKSELTPTDRATRCVTPTRRAVHKAGRGVFSTDDGRRSTVDNTWPVFCFSADKQ